MLLAKRFADHVNWPFEDLFAHQFVLAPAGEVEIEAFRALPFDGRTLHHSPRLDVAALSDMDGRFAGYCLGIAIDSHGARVRERRIDRARIGEAGFWAAAETFVIGLAGRYLALLTDGTQRRIYGDPSSHYNCLYDPVTGFVGSSLGMSLNRLIRRNGDVDNRLVTSGALRPPFNRTCDRFARRLAGNHYLRLDDLTETRFWPRPGELEEAGAAGLEGAMGEIAARLSEVFGGIVRSAPAAMAMSGGNDSRSVVAAGRDSLGRVSRFFCRMHNRTSRADCTSAAMVAAALGFELEVHEAAKRGYTPEEAAARRSRFFAASGYGVGPHPVGNVKFDARPPEGELMMLGNVMEILRASHWGAGERSRRHNRKFGLKRCLFVRERGFTPEFVARWLPEFEAWMDALPPDAQHVYIDMAFIEHNLPNMGCLFIGQRSNFSICPFNDRRLIGLAARLPLGYRYSNEANRELLRQTAPELLDVPYEQDVMAEAGRRTRKRAARKGV